MYILTSNWVLRMLVKKCFSTFLAKKLKKDKSKKMRHYQATNGILSLHPNAAQEWRVLFPPKLAFLYTKTCEAASWSNSYGICFIIHGTKGQGFTSRWLRLFCSSDGYDESRWWPDPESRSCPPVWSRHLREGGNTQHLSEDKYVTVFPSIRQIYLSLKAALIQPPFKRTQKTTEIKTKGIKQD